MLAKKKLQNSFDESNFMPKKFANIKISLLYFLVIIIITKHEKKRHTNMIPTLLIETTHKKNKHKNKKLLRQSDINLMKQTKIKKNKQQNLIKRSPIIIPILL